MSDTFNIFDQLPEEIRNRMGAEVTRIVACSKDKRDVMELFLIPLDEEHPYYGTVLTLAVLAHGHVPTQESVTDMDPNQGGRHKNAESWIAHYSDMASEMIRRALLDYLHQVTIFPHYMADADEKNGPTHVIKCSGHYHVWKMDPITGDPIDFDDGLADESHTSLGQIINDAIAHIYVPMAKERNERHIDDDDE